jgi:LacI family transcriptional regulator
MIVRQKKRVTLEDVAKYCGLSKSTVAYVLRKPDTCKATPKTREKVAAAVRKLGYRPNPAARALSTQRYNSVGILFPPCRGHHNTLLEELDKEMRKHNYFSVFSFWEPDNSEVSFKDSLFRLCNHGIDGIITTEYNELVCKLNMPVVIYGNEWPACDCVYPDKTAYIRETVDYLCRRNHRKIAFLGRTVEIRCKVLREELAKRRLRVNEDWFISCTFLEAEEAMRKLLALPERPDAIILHSDSMAPGVLTAADEAGVRIPEDISLISYDNLYESRYTRPALTTFDQCLPLAAKMLTETILLRISNPQTPPLKLSFEMPLVERDSVMNR